MASLTANNFKGVIARGENDFNSDTYKICLMDKDYVFNRVTHEKYADFSTYELPSLYGYTAGGQTLTNIVLTQNDTLNAFIMSWDNAAWTAAAGDIESCGAIIYNDTIVTPDADPVLGFIDFGGNLVALNGGVFTVTNITFAIKAYTA
jgi:hypothetical protein